MSFDHPSISSCSYKDLSNELRKGSESRPLEEGEEEEPIEDEEKEKELLAMPSLWRIYKLNHEEWGFLFFGAIGSIILGVTSPFFAIAFR